jgi:hypothetical protein
VHYSNFSSTTLISCADISTRCYRPAQRTLIYNCAAAALKLSAKLTWEQVAEYTFLADFDLLRLARQDIHGENQLTKRCTTHFQDGKGAGGDSAFECRDLASYYLYVRDEEVYLEKQEGAAKDMDPKLAHQIYLHRMDLVHVHSLHLSHFRNFSVCFSVFCLPWYDVNYCLTVDLFFSVYALSMEGATPMG